MKKALMLGCLIEGIAVVLSFLYFADSVTAGMIGLCGVGLIAAFLITGTMKE